VPLRESGVEAPSHVVSTSSSSTTSTVSYEPEIVSSPREYSGYVSVSEGVSHSPEVSSTSSTVPAFEEPESGGFEAVSGRVVSSSASHKLGVGVVLFSFMLIIPFVRNWRVKK